MFRLLSFSGALAAFVIGAIIFGAGGYTLAAPLLVFFFTSSLITWLGREKKCASNTIYQKAGPRDAAQVLANGAVPALLALLYTLSTYQSRPFALLYLSSLAAVNADTWATEIGSVLGGTPRSVINWKPCTPGVSGAISSVGTVAALFGALIIPLSVLPFWTVNLQLLYRPDAAEILTICWAGFIAALVDSLLGATVQGQFHCSVCNQLVESPVHCMTDAKHVRGLVWFSNDMVNLFTSLSAVLFAWFIFRYFAYPL